jgi:putative ABC transport system permease protein
MSAIYIGLEAVQAWRSLLRRPQFLLLSAFTLALGIAASAAVFSLFHQAFLRPLPFQDPARLVSVGGQGAEDGQIASPGLYRVLRESDRFASSGLATAFTRKFTVSATDVPVVANVMSADRGFIETLGVRMALGRNFEAEEDRPDGPRVAVLHYRFWEREFGGSRDVLDRVFRIEDREYRAIGVLPQDFLWPETFDVIVPLRLRTDTNDLDGNQYMVARLGDGVKPVAASAEVARIAQRQLADLRAQMPPEAYDYLSGLRYSAQPLASLYRGDAGRSLWLFFAAGCCVLLIAAINLTNLIVLRAVLRSHDSAVRTAMGASVRRLAVQPLAESLLIGACGGLFGLLLAAFGLRMLAGFIPPDWLSWVEITLSPAAFGFALACGLGVSLFATLLGIWRSSRQDGVKELVGGGRSGLSRGVGWLARLLVSAQVGVAMVLLVTAGLFMRDLYRQATVPIGFQSQDIVTFSLAPAKSRHPDIAAVLRQTRDVLDRLNTLPGVQAASVGSNAPAGSQLNLPATLADERTIQPQFRAVDPGYFPLYAIRLIAGRAFSERDDAAAEAVCIVSRSFADQHYAGDALGKTVRMGRPGSGNVLPQMRIVGIVEDVRHQGPDEAAVPTLYVPMSQLPDPLWGSVREYVSLSYAVRGDGVSVALEPALRRAVIAVSPDQPITDIRMMKAIVDGTMVRGRLQLLLVGVFAGLALLLASVGLYAILAVTIAARSHEYGVRVALGAKPIQLVALVLKDSARQMFIGWAVGIAVALALAGPISNFVAGLDIYDPLTLFAVTVLLAVAGLLASIQPAIRIARVDPLQALRAE